AIPVLPEWYYAKLVKVYGKDAAARMAEAQLIPSVIDVTVKSDPDHWAAKLNGTVMPNGSVRLGSFEGSVSGLDGFTDGEWWVQDFSASMPVRLMGNLAGKRVADLCAAPGVKTAQPVLAGAEVTALDQSANRLQRLRENLDRLQLKAETLQTNIVKFQPEESLDSARLDAPCSPTATLRTNPVVCSTTTAKDISNIV
ncbi:MFS transporter, partial [Klebsiella pneumoniae]